MYHTVFLIVFLINNLECSQYLDVKEDCSAGRSKGSFLWHSYTFKLLEVLMLKIVCSNGMTKCLYKPRKLKTYWPYWPLLYTHSHPKFYRKLNLVKIIWTKKILSAKFISFREKDLPYKPTRNINHTKHFYDTPPLKDTCTHLRKRPEQWNSCSVCSYCRRWDLYTPPGLGSNITITELLTSAKHNLCSMGRFAIFGSTLVRGKLDLGQPMSKLCGHFSFFRMYFVRNAHLRLFTTFHSLFVLDGFITVCSNFMEYSHFKTIKITGQPMFYFKSPSTRIVSYFSIETNKTCHIKLNIAPKGGLNAEVFDGPGKLSKTLLPLHNIYITSSFTCLLLMKVNFDEGILASPNNIDKMFSVNFSSSYCAMNQKYFLKPGFTKAFMLSKENMTFSPYFFLVQTGASSKINITIVKMSYHRAYLDTVACRYGGLVGVDYPHKDYEEVGLFCDDHDSSEGLSRSMYSQNASFLLVLYWFRSYSDISVTLEISSTQCSSVRYDSCSSAQSGPVPSNPVVKMYAHRQIETHFGVESAIVYTYSVEDNDCVVIQFSFTQSLGTEVCKLHKLSSINAHKLRRFETESTFQRELMYIIEGSLQPSSCNTICGNKGQHNIRYEHVVVENIKATKEFCFLFGSNLTCKYHVDYLRKHSNYFVSNKDISTLFQNNRDTRQFYLSAKIQSNFFPFNIFHFPHTESWTEITIWNEKSSVEGFEFTSVKQELFFTNKEFTHFDPKIIREFVNTRVALLHVATRSKSRLIPKIKIDTHFTSWYPTFNPTHSSITEISLKTSLLSFFMSFCGNYPSTIFSWNTSEWKENVSIHFQLMLINNNYQYSFHDMKEVHLQKKRQNLVVSGREKVQLSDWIGRYWVYLRTSVQIKCRVYKTADLTIPKLHSWKQSSHLCVTMNSKLPYFTHSDELQEFITFFKLDNADKDYGVFIGLQTRKVFHTAAEIITIVSVTEPGNKVL